MPAVAPEADIGASMAEGLISTTRTETAGCRSGCHRPGKVTTAAGLVGPPSVRVHGQSAAEDRPGSRGPTVRAISSPGAVGRAPSRAFAPASASSRRRLRECRRPRHSRAHPHTQPTPEGAASPACHCRGSRVRRAGKSPATEPQDCPWCRRSPLTTAVQAKQLQHLTGPGDVRHHSGRIARTVACAHPSARLSLSSKARAARSGEGDPGHLHAEGRREPAERGQGRVQLYGATFPEGPKKTTDVGGGAELRRPARRGRQRAPTEASEPSPAIGIDLTRKKLNKSRE
jgi:hypothetical protein